MKKRPKQPEKKKSSGLHLLTFIALPLVGVIALALWSEFQAVATYRCHESDEEKPLRFNDEFECPRGGFMSCGVEPCMLVPLGAEDRPKPVNPKDQAPLAPGVRYRLKIQSNLGTH